MQFVQSTGVTCPEASLPTAKVNIVDPDNLAVPVTDITVGLEQNMVVVRATFTPATAGTYHAVTILSRGLGMPQQDVVVAEDHCDASVGFASDAGALASCSQLTVTSGGLLVCTLPVIAAFRGPEEVQSFAAATSTTLVLGATVGDVLWVARGDTVERFVEAPLADGGTSFVRTPDVAYTGVDPNLSYLLPGATDAIVSSFGGAWRIFVAPDGGLAQADPLLGTGLPRFPDVPWRRDPQFGGLIDFEFCFSPGDGGAVDCQSDPLASGGQFEAFGNEPTGLWRVGRFTTGAVCVITR
jgi:hypothetical protein